MPDDLILDLANMWRRTFGMDFREFRHEMKQIALATMAACRNCYLLTSFHPPSEPGADDLFVFMDDDDWISPGLFDMLRANETPQDGFLWGSIYLGKLLVDLPGHPVGSPVLQKRKLQDIVYTNNYAVTGLAVKRLGIQTIFEHGDAQKNLDIGAFRPQKIPP